MKVCTLCGDGALDNEEECDDKNSLMRDGCSDCSIDDGY